MPEKPGLNPLADEFEPVCSISGEAFILTNP
jgi:hypothetical protein